MSSNDSRLWSVPVAVSDVPAIGREVTIVADAATRTAVAAALGLRALPSLTATFDLSRQGREGLRVTGTVSATVGQTCVVTLEPIENEVVEPVDVVFSPGADIPAGPDLEPLADAPEPLIGGVVDLGAVAVEFLALAIDPYPRKPDAEFRAPSSGEPRDSPFAALAALKKGRP